MFKKVISLKGALSLFALGFLISETSCSSYSITKSLNGDGGYGNYCSNPQYVATMYKAYNIVKSDSSATFITLPSYDLQITTLLKDARKVYGQDVTINNLRFDVKNGKKKVGVVYDVIKCK